MKLHIYPEKTQAISAAQGQLRSLITDASTDLYLSGGSAVSVFEAFNEDISTQQKTHVHLYQVDERYGLVGHEDANWPQLEACASGQYASTNLVLSGQEFKQTALAYNEVVQESLTSTHIKVALLGVGADAHIAGIKPMSKEEYELRFEDKLFTAYSWSDYERLSLSYTALKQFDHLVVFAAGRAKSHVIDSLAADQDVYRSPIHFLKQHVDAHIFYSKE